MPSAELPAPTSVGRLAETRAAQFLEAHGARIIARNFRVRGGEIDLIVEESGEVVFVEVRSRARADYGSAAESVDARKQRRITLAAKLWLQRYQQGKECACRFDCIFIEAGHLRWERHAFAAD